MIEQQSEIIPIFPLTRVLFPKMMLPLHIFEEKYKLMVKYCLGTNSLFGVMNRDDLKSGAVGTATEIHRVLKRYDDGRYDLLIHGTKRFRMKRLVLNERYLQAEVSYFEDELEIALPQAKIDSLIQLYKAFVSRLGLKQEQWSELISIVQNLNRENEISYIIGQTIGLNQEQQAILLGETSSCRRVEKLISELQRRDQLNHVARKLYEGSDFDPVLN